MPAWAAHVESGAQQARDETHRLDAIQGTLIEMPVGALQELLLDFWRAGHSDDPAAIRETVDDWYRKALFMLAEDQQPVDLEDFPDRPLP